MHELQEIQLSLCILADVHGDLTVPNRGYVLQWFRLPKFYLAGDDHSNLGTNGVACRASDVDIAGHMKSVTTITVGNSFANLLLRFGNLFECLTHGVI